MRQSMKIAFAALLAVLCLAVLAPSTFASSKATGPTLSLSTGTATTFSSGSMTVPAGTSVHIASTNLSPASQAVLYKGQWQPSSQFVGWAYVYYKGYWPSADGTIGLDETQNTSGTFRYQICQSSTSRGKTTTSCSPYVELTVS